MTNILTTKFDFEIENFIAVLYFLHKKYKPNLRINLLRLNCKSLVKNTGTYFARSSKMQVLTRGTGKSYMTFLPIIMVPDALLNA